MSVTLYGTVYSGLTYVGVGDDFEEQPGATLTVDLYGMDTITRTFSGRLDKCISERDKYKRNRDVRDLRYSHMFITDYFVSETAPFATLTYTAKGVYDGSTPQPVPEWGVRSQEISLSFTGDDVTETTGETATFTYFAPYTTWHYWTESEPKAAKYRQQLKLTSEAFQITSMSGDATRNLNFKRGGDFQGGTQSSLTALANTFNATIEIVTTQFDVKPVGKWFTVTETNEGRITPMGLANRNKRIINVDA